MMKSQSEVFQGTGFAVDEIDGWFPTAAEKELLAVAEGYSFAEWSKAIETIGLEPGIKSLPENFEKAVHEAGRWTKEYISKQQLYE